jgi:[ribosomal protein S5]-alanine N-acetyltransferase
MLYFYGMLQLKNFPFPVLTTERLTLRRITHDDENEIFFLRSNEEVMKLIHRPRPASLEDIKPFIQKINDMIDGNDGISWAMALKNEPKMIGHISFHRVIKEHYRAEVGYMMHPDHYGKGIMHEALGAVLHYGFVSMGLHSIEAIVNPENSASIKLLERNNFIREAYFREDFFWEGKFLDSAVYSLIAPGNAV